MRKLDEFEKAYYKIINEADEATNNDEMKEEKPRPQCLTVIPI